MIRLSDLLHLRSWIGDCNKMSAGLCGAYGLLRTLEKILLEDVWLKSAARLARNNEESLRDIDLMFERFDLRGIGGIQNVQSRELRDSAKCHPQNFRTQARSAHAQQQDVFKTASVSFFR